MPSFDLLSAAASSLTNLRRSLCQLEIRPEADFILLRGDPDGTAGSIKYKGRVVLMTSEKIELKGLRVVFEGRRKSIRVNPCPKPPPTPKPHPPPIVNKSRFLRTQFDVKDSRGNAIRSVPAGNHEWPFEFDLPGDMPESIEGMESFITYNIKVTGDRGVWAKDLEADRHIRVIRTLSEDSLELVDAHSIPGVWPDKVKYNFNIPAKAAIFGTTLITDVELTPLLEKIGFEKIKIIVNEIVKVKTIPPPHPSHPDNSHGMWRSEKTVATKEMSIPADSNATDPETLLPMHRFKICTPLPRSLSDCRQDVHHNEWFQIKHHVYYEVTINNPAGHQSMLRTNHELNLFISPNLPIDEHNQVPEFGGDRIVHDSNLLGDMQAAPPLYQTHRLDRLYDDIDTSGYMTPTPWSGAQTPRVPASFSRRGSSDNLGSLATLAALPEEQQGQQQHTPPHHTASNEPLASALENRLANLQVNGVEHRHHQGHNRHSSPGSPAEGAGPSNEYFEESSRARVQTVSYFPEESEAVEHIEYDMAALERVTSYDTAVRSRPYSWFTDEPPDYGQATSTPPSPPT